MENEHDKSHRGNASQFFVAGELCRRGLVANVTLGNCPNVDILCTNIKAKHFVHIQVKTFIPGDRTCSVGIKSEKDFGNSFFWVLAGIPKPGQQADFQYFVIPCQEMAKNMWESHKIWSKTRGKKGQKHDSTTKFRALVLPPGENHNGWKVDKYLNRWDLILDKTKP